MLTETGSRLNGADGPFGAAACRHRIARTASREDTLARQVICISHATGAGGAAIGRAVAERLGFRYVDDEVISAAAEGAEVAPALVADAERRKPFVARLLGGFGGGGER